MLFKLTFRRLLPSYLAIALIFIAQVGNAFAALWLPSLNAHIIDDGVVKGDVPYIWRTGVLMLGVTLVQAVLSILATYLATRLAMNLGARLREEMFRQVQRFSAAEVREFSAASLITRSTNDVQQVQMVTLMTFTIMIMAPIMAIGGVVMAIQQDAKLSLLLVVSVPVLIIIVGILMALLRPRFLIQQKRLDRVSAVMREQFTGVRVIRAFVKQKFMAARFDAANRDLKEVALSIGRLFALMFPLIQIVLSGSSVAVIWFSGILLDRGDMQVGSMIAFLNYLMQILFSVMIAAMIFAVIPRAEVSARRISAVLEATPEIQSPPAPKPLPEGPLTFALDAVTLRFPGAEAPVLTDLNLTFAPGTVTGIIGSTGAGKTTLVSLLARQLDPTSGRVTAGGVDLREVDLAALRKRVALVPQKAYLFSGTVATTVASKRELTPAERERVEWALSVAQADFVADLEDGIDHAVSPGGVNFSGGQRQRLTIARALYKHADLLIFDDSFSALDYATDARLRAALRREVREPAVVMVAQRVSTVRHADQIVVLENGAVVGLGTHEQLRESCPTYQEIVASQLTAEEASR